jgi:hypothetical protein
VFIIISQKLQLVFFIVRKLRRNRLYMIHIFSRRDHRFFKDWKFSFIRIRIYKFLNLSSYRFCVYNFKPFVQVHWPIQDRYGIYVFDIADANSALYFRLFYIGKLYGRSAGNKFCPFSR